MHPQSDLVRDTLNDGNYALAEGLMLVRASTLKVIRLQLAMERGDRRVAIAAIDDLLALERRLEACLANAPPFPHQRDVEQDLQLDRSALNCEKLTLAAEIRRNADGQVLFQSSVPDEPHDVHLISQPLPAEPATGTFAERQPWVAHPHEPRPRWWWLLGLMLLFAVVAAAAFLFGAFEQTPRLETIFRGLA